MPPDTEREILDRLAVIEGEIKQIRTELRAGDRETAQAVHLLTRIFDDMKNRVDNHAGRLREQEHQVARLRAYAAVVAILLPPLSSAFTAVMLNVIGGGA